MRTIGEYLKGIIGKEKLLEHIKKNPELVPQARELLTEKNMSIEELELIAGAGIEGTAQDDTLFGDDHNNSMFGYGGDDSMKGGDGDDSMKGGDGDDCIEGQAGNDRLEGEDGNDALYGGEGNDKLDGGGGNDFLDGGEGKDRLYGGAGNDTLNGGNGADFLMDSTGDDVMNGGAGDDYITVLSGNNTLTGGEGRDGFYFSTSQAGTNTITDYTPGEDKIILANSAHGEFTVNYSSETGNTTIACGDTFIIVEGQQLTEDDIYIMNPDAALGTDGDDFLIGNQFDRGSTIDGGAGNDTIEGLFEDDTIIGGIGDDTLAGGHGNDTFIFNAGDGNDVIKDFAPGEDTIQLNNIESDEFSIDYDPNTGNSIITYDGGTITVEGVEVTEADISIILEGGAQPETLDGTGGGDTITGGAGDDVITGGGGDDTIDGESGDDVIDGGAGDDLLTGGSGGDTFVFGKNDGNDIVTDFNPEQDKLNLSGAQAPSDLIVEIVDGNTVITFGDTTITLEGVEMSLSQVWASMEV